MKLNLTTQKTITSDNMIGSKMGVDTDSVDMLTMYLRDKIYSDKIMAPIREYITNAIDETIKHNIDTPVKVSLVKNNNNNWTWSVRDYAKGLSEHDVRNIFGMYGKSTKRQDQTQIGSYGLGSKSAFAYCDVFYLTSHHNGTKSSYVCSLGRGDNGVSVGEIFKVSDEPTDEQGIEIGIEITSYGDESQFNFKTRCFVGSLLPDSKVLFYNLNGDMVIPNQPINTIDIGGYVFGQYSEISHISYDNKTYYVRMGGVVYPHTTKTRVSRNFTMPVIVDVPIGALTIPISRESIENTPLNEKVFAEIENYLDKIQVEEKATLVVPKFGQIVSGQYGPIKDHDGRWFNYSFSECFPITRKFSYVVGKVREDLDVMNGNVYTPDTQKFAIYIFPDIKSIRNWHKRLINALKQIQGNNYNGYCYIRRKDYELLLSSIDDTIDLSDCIFIDIKTLKLPKLEKENIDKNSYLVYDNYANKHYLTSEELDIRASKGNNFEDDWHLEVVDYSILNSRTIGKVSEFGTRSAFWSANSQKMIDNLVELGWLTPHMPEYIKAKSRIDEIIKYHRQIRNIEGDLNGIYYNTKCNPKTLERLHKNPNKINLFEVVKKNILKEDSTRARILKMMKTYDNYMTREDLRKILKMKS